MPISLKEENYGILRCGYDPGTILRGKVKSLDKFSKCGVIELTSSLDTFFFQFSQIEGWKKPKKGETGLENLKDFPLGFKEETLVDFRVGSSLSMRGKSTWVAVKITPA